MIEDTDVLDYFKNKNSAIPQIRINSLNELFEMANMSHLTIENLNNEVLRYSRENLVKVVVYIPFPFVSRYVLHEVRLAHPFTFLLEVQYKG